MKIVKVTLEMPYRYGEHSHKAETDKESVLAALTDLQIRHNPEDPSVFFCTSDQAIDVMALFPHSYHDVYLKKAEVVFDGASEVREQMDAVLNRMNIAAARLETQIIAGTSIDGLPGFHEGVPGWNNRAAAPIPGPALTTFNDLSLCEDACTDAIQSMLYEGWRIVAVCPQESRRPDYVLGRVNPNNDVRTNARRWDGQ